MRVKRVAATRAIYDARALLPFDGHTNTEEVARAVDLLCQLEPNRDARVCDVGCGGGWHLLELNRRGFSCLYGIDLSAETLLVASQVCRNTSATLIFEDIANSSQPEFFDVATVFNATLGSGSKSSDLSFVRGVAKQLRPGGQLLITYFPHELVAAHVGHFSVTYSESKDTVVNSLVEFDPLTSELSIHQSVGDTTLPSERLRLYSRSQMESLLADAGFVVQRSTSKHGDQLAKFGIGWIAATKGHE